MSKAIPISTEDWKFASRIKNQQDFFNFLSRTFVNKNSVPAQKLHAVEFINKP